MAKQWFYIIHQEENEMIKTPVQLAVFGAIKSFCANGKRNWAISIREIASRSKVSNGWISKVVRELITLGLIEIVGQETRVGGIVSVYRVKRVNSKTLKDNKVFTEQTLSVHPVVESVHSLGTNQDKVKRNKSNNTKNTFLEDKHIDNFPKSVRAGFSLEQRRKLMAPYSTTPIRGQR